MEINEIANNRVVDSATGVFKKGKGGEEMGKNDFMMLLMEQIKNQDPLKPMENVEFTAQLAQFNMLSQMGTTNKTLETILDAQTSLSNAAAINLIGKKIEIPGNEVQLNNGSADLLYHMPQAATNVNINIYNNERLVGQLTDQPKEKGSHKVIWDGKGILGNQLSDGAYTFKVAAQDPDGIEIDAIESITGEATDIIFEGNNTFVNLNNKKVTLGDISKISIK